MGNPNAAARSLGVDHNTVRRRVQALEGHLGVKLFAKQDNRFVLNAGGDRLLAVVQQVEAALASTEEDIVGSQRALSGTVRVGIADGGGALFLAPRLPKFMSNHPNLNIELILSSQRFDLAMRDVDIAIIVGRPSGGHIVVRKVTDMIMRLYASKDYLESHPPINSVSDLADHVYVGGMDHFDFRPEFDRAANPNDSIASPRLRSSSVVALLKAVLAGVGLSMFARCIVEGEDDIREVLPDEVFVKREIWLAMHREYKDIARIRAVASFIVSEFVSNRQLFE